MSPAASTPDGFTVAEVHAIARALREGGPAKCPRCGAAFDARPVLPRDDVSYVRDRVWLVCPRCHRQVVVDRRDP